MACPIALSYYLIDALLNHLTNQATFAPPAALYVALYTGSPGADNSGPEVSSAGSSGYARQLVSWTAVTTHQVSNSVVITFPTAGTNWGTVSYAALFDAVSGGNLIAFTALDTAENVTVGSVFQINLHQLVLAFQ